jgi:hypothetical protein
VDANPGDGTCDADALTAGDQCSLRAAIQEANASADADIIILSAGIYTLSLVGVGEDLAATGDLDITDELTITGAGATSTVIDGNLYGSAADRVFDVRGSGKVNITGVTIRNGLVIGDNGGGIMNNGDLSLTDVIVDHNEATHHYSTGGSDGGGIYNSGTLALNNVDIRNNKYKSGGSGGGIYNSSTGTLTLNNSSVSRNGNVNTCVSGVDNEGTFISNNSTISENIATSKYCVGPAVLNNGHTASTALNNTTITGNIPVGVFKGHSLAFTLQNTIIAGNGETGTSDCHANSLSIDSLGYNLIGAADCTINSTTGDQIGTFDTPIDAKLGRLISSPAYNPLLSGSPNIDAGNPAGCTGSDGALVTDQRGAARVGLCDIGAYEFTTPGPAATVYANRGSSQHIGPLRALRTPIEAAVMDSIGSPVGSVEVTFNVPTSGPSGAFGDTGTATTKAFTDQSGVATAATLTANELLGGYTATATVDGIANPANFELTNLVWYVAEDGDDIANDCLSPSSPCATVNGIMSQYAKANFIAGDTIRVSTGTYTGTGVDQVILLNQNVILSGGWDSTFASQNGTSIIDGENARKCITVEYNVSDFTIERFTAQNGSGNGGGGIRINAGSNGIIKNSTIRSNDGGGLHNEGDRLVIENCVITGNTSPDYGGGIMNFGELMVNTCTIADNTADYDGGGIYSSGGSLTMTNSILWVNSPNELIFTHSAGSTITYSTIKEGWTGQGNIPDDPMFIDSENGDYHLDDNSPCIGAGTHAGAPNIDLEGNPRPNPPGSNPDMGAYENNRDIPYGPPDIFGIKIGNKWTYQGTYMGTNSYTWEAEVVTLDQTTFPITTYIVKDRVNGSLEERSWYEKAADQLKFWGGETGGDMIKFSTGLVETWYPMEVNDHVKTFAKVEMVGYPDIILDVSLTADVVNKELVNLSFGVLETFKIRYEFRTWGYGVDETETFYNWGVPYLGIVKYQDEEVMEELTSFAIAGGTITQETDADRDGLKDYKELIIYETNWQDTDTDNDGLTDGDEVNTHGTDPNTDDTDSDGLTDGDELNIHGTDPNDADTDNDGLIDADEVNTHGCDPNDDDTDDDGLQDGDEIALGTNPTKADTDGDGDSDGDEVMYGSDPLLITDTLESHRPYKPVVLTVVEDVPLQDHIFDADEFSDPDQYLGDYLSASEWQISTGENFGQDDIIFHRMFEKQTGDSIAESELRQLLIPDAILLKANSYWIRTRHQDSVGLWSPWSDPVVFSTVTIDPNDIDDNGIDDECQVQGYADTNNNDIDDSNEDILAFYDAEGGDLIGMGTSNGTLGSFDAIPNSEIPFELMPEDPMPCGLFSFRVDGLPVDAGNPATVDIIFFFPEPLPAGTKWYKYDTAGGTMTDFTANIVINGNSVVLSLADGGPGDADRVVNGIIIDPSGPAVPTPGAVVPPTPEAGTGGGGGGGGGCFITNIARGFNIAETFPALTLLLGFFVMCIVGCRSKFKK